MYYVVGLCVLVCTIACNSSSKGTASGTGSGSSVVSAPTATATGECKPLDVCARFPLEKVEKLCGGGLAKVAPTNTVSDAYLIDACEYQIANRATMVSIARTCMTAKGGGASMNGQAFQMGHDAKLRNNEVEDPASGLGDKAYYRTMKKSVVLHILKGNVTLEVRSDTETELAVKQQQCLVVIANELLAL